MVTIKTIIAQLLLPLVAAVSFSQLWSNAGQLTPITAWKHAGQQNVDVWSVETPSPSEEDPKAWAQSQSENPSSWASPVQPQREEVPTSWTNAEEPQREEVPTSWASAGKPQSEEVPTSWPNAEEPQRDERSPAWGRVGEHEPGWEQENSLVGEDQQPKGWNVYGKSSSRHTDEDYVDYLKFKEFMRLKKNLAWNRNSYPN